MANKLPFKLDSDASIERNVIYAYISGPDWACPRAIGLVVSVSCRNEQGLRGLLSLSALLHSGAPLT